MSVKFNCHKDIAFQMTQEIAVNMDGRHHISKSKCPIAVFEINGVQMSACWFHSTRNKKTGKRRGRKIVVRYPWPSEYLGRDSFGEPIWGKQEGFAIECSDVRQMTKNPLVDWEKWIKEKCKGIKDMAEYMTGEDRDVAKLSHEPKECKCGKAYDVQFHPNLIEGTGHLFIKWYCASCGHKEDMKKEEFEQFTEKFLNKENDNDSNEAT